jgi:uncharacterized membrane protein
MAGSPGRAKPGLESELKICSGIPREEVNPYQCIEIDMARILLLVGFAGLIVYLALARYLTFHTGSFDLAIYDQFIWGITNGEYYSSLREIHFFAHHVQPVLFLMVPFYALGAGPGLLLVVQSLALAAAAWPLYLLAKERTGSARTAFMWACLLCAFPPFQYLGLCGFHPGVMAVPLIFTAMLAYQRERYLWQWVCMLGAVCCQENIAPVFIFWGIAILFERRKTPAKWRNGLAMVICWLSYFAFALLVIKPAFATTDVDTHFTYYSQFGDSYGEMVMTFLTRPRDVIAYAFTGVKLHYLLLLGLPLLFLPLGAPRLLIPILPVLAINLLSNHPGTTNIKYHFSFHIIPFLFLAGLEGYCRLRDIDRRWTKRALPVAVITVAVISYLMWSPLPGGGRYWSFQYRDQPQSIAYKKLLPLIPPDASASAPVLLTPHLSHRRELYLFPSLQAKRLECDHVVIDLTRDNRKAQEARRDYLIAKGYEARKITNYLFLLSKK